MAKKEKKTSIIFGGLGSLFVSIIFFLSDKLFWGWIFLMVFSYGVTSGLLQPYMSKKRASNFAAIPVLLIFCYVIYNSIIIKGKTNLVLSVSWAVIVILLTLLIYGIFSDSKSRKKHYIFSFTILLFSVSLFIIYHRFARDIFIVNLLFLFMITSYCRQALYELITGDKIDGENIWAYLFADVIVFSLLFAGIFFYKEVLFFHLLVINLVVVLFRYSTERFISEISLREHKKVDKEYKNQNIFSFFTSLTKTHYSINLAIISLVFIYLSFDLSLYMNQIKFQSDVFQASISLLGIIAGFSILVLGDRVTKKGKKKKKQTYLLQGLLGITFLYSIIALISFIGISVGNIDISNTFSLENIISMQSFASYEYRLYVLQIFTNEYIYYAVPISLLYFFSLSVDMSRNYKNEEED